MPSTVPGVERALTQIDCCCLRIVILSINNARAQALAELRLDLVTVVCIFRLSAAPSQPPRIISSVRSGSRYVITWDHVIALANESTVTGYKVCNGLLDYSAHKVHCCKERLILVHVAVLAKPIQLSCSSCVAESAGRAP